MAIEHDTMMNPGFEELLERTQSKFSLVTLGAQRARQINSYYNQLGDSTGSMVPPQVASVARKPLSIAFEEIAADKIVAIDVSDLADPDASPGETLVGAVAEVLPTSEPEIGTEPAGSD